MPSAPKPVTDPDDAPCYRHPTELTALQCTECDRAICTECAVSAPVGMKCPECSRQSRSAQGKVPRQRLVAAMLASGGAALALAIAHMVVNLSFLSLILAWVLGRLVGAAARKASGGFRDPAVVRIAGCAAGAGFIAAYAPAILTLQAGLIVWSLLYAVAAVVGAIQQANT